MFPNCHCPSHVLHSRFLPPSFTCCSLPPSCKFAINWFHPQLSSTVLKWTEKLLYITQWTICLFNRGLRETKVPQNKTRLFRKIFIYKKGMWSLSLDIWVFISYSYNYSTVNVVNNCKCSSLPKKEQNMNHTYFEEEEKIKCGQNFTSPSRSGNAFRFVC